MRNLLITVLAVTALVSASDAAELMGPPPPRIYGFDGISSEARSHGYIGAPVILGNAALWGSTWIDDKISTPAALKRCPACYEGAAGWSGDVKANIVIGAASLGLRAGLRKERSWFVREFIPMAIPLAFTVVHVRAKIHNDSIR